MCVRLLSHVGYIYLICCNGYTSLHSYQPFTSLPTLKLSNFLIFAMLIAVKRCLVLICLFLITYKLEHLFIQLIQFYVFCHFSFYPLQYVSLVFSIWADYIGIYLSMGINLNHTAGAKPQVDPFWPIKIAKSMAQLTICCWAYWSSQIFSIINNIAQTIYYDIRRFSYFEFFFTINP